MFCWPLKLPIPFLTWTSVDHNNFHDPCLPLQGPLLPTQSSKTPGWPWGTQPSPDENESSFRPFLNYVQKIRVYEANENQWEWHLANAMYFLIASSCRVWTRTRANHPRRNNRRRPIRRRPQRQLSWPWQEPDVSSNQSLQRRFRASSRQQVPGGSLHHATIRPPTHRPPCRRLL